MFCLDRSWQMLCVILSPCCWCENEVLLRQVFFCQSSQGTLRFSVWCPAAPLCKNLRTSSHVTGCDGAAVSSRSARSRRSFGTVKGSVAAAGSKALVRRAPRDSRSLSAAHPPAHVFPARSGASQNKQGEINTCSGQLSAG